MRLSFIFPYALLLLPLLPLLWALAFVLPRARRGARFWGVLALRSVALLSLVLALAGTQLVRPVDELTVVFLVDASDSVAPAQRQQALDLLAAALRAKRPGDQAAVVLFGENALVERAPSVLVELGRLSSTPIGSSTDIGGAIQLGMALFPADQQKRLVLLSDGGENRGRALEAARIAAVRGIPIDVVPLVGVDGDDALVVALDAPDSVREGQELTLRADLRSSVATTGRLQIFADGALVSEQEVQLPAGNSSVAIGLPGGDAGFHRYEVRLEAQGDTQPANNRAAAFTNVQGPPRVLLVASDPGRAAPLQQALAAASVRVDLLPPVEVPADQTRLGEYAAVILVDLPARDLPRGVQEALPVYVRELGRGLAMIGGSDSFGAGGWRRTPVAEVLPVELDPLDQQQRPDLGLVLVIDRSGSMSEAGGGGLTKLDLAKEAVYQATQGLQRNDQVGVVAFDDGASWALELQRLPDPAAIELALGTIGLGGGTNIRSGVEPAAQALAGVDARVKHVILLTDGYDNSRYDDLLKQMRDANTTITVVAVGSEVNPALQQIAEQGGGRYYRVLQAADVPRIFLSETVLVAGRDIVEGRFVPVVALPAAAVRGLDTLPPLTGYNATEQRSTARTILVTPDGKPLLAQWQYGLGRSVAWTSDLKGQWARAWLNWDQFPRFVGGLLDALLPPPQMQGLVLEARADPVTGAAVLELNALDGAGLPLEDVTVEGRLLDPAQQGAPLRFSQVGPGRYRALAPASAVGVYLAQVTAIDAGGQPLGSASSGLVVSYSPEYSTRSENPQLLGELALLTGGLQGPAAETLFASVTQPVGLVQEVSLPLLTLALLLWPLDIALRRLLLRRSDFAPVLARLRLGSAAPRPTLVDPTIARLRAAKREAADRRRESGGTQPLPETTAPQPSAPEPQAPAATTQPTLQVEADGAIGRLLAAKQRAQRKKRDGA